MDGRTEAKRACRSFRSIACLPGCPFFLPKSNSRVRRLGRSHFSQISARAFSVGTAVFLGLSLLAFSSSPPAAPWIDNNQQANQENPQKAAETKKGRKKAAEKQAEEEALLRPHEEIVVTATMTRKAVADCSPSVSVMTAKEIDTLRPSNLLNILNFLPGIFLERTGDFGRADVEIRGLGERGTRITIMTDGRPEKMGLFGCAVTHAFPLVNVSRIEVVRGPASVLYGSDALGGVINIMTKRPEPGFQSDFSGFYGSFNTKEFTLQHGGGFDTWNYFLTLDRRSSDGQLPHSAYDGDNVTAQASWTPSKRFEVSLRSKYFSGRKDDPGPITAPEAWSSTDYKRGAVDLSFTGRWTYEEFTAKLYRDFGHHQFSDGWDSRDTVDGGVFRLTSKRWKNNELTVGSDFRIQAGRSYHFPVGRWNKHELAGFLQNEHVFADRWIFSSGLRLNDDSVYGTELVPSVGLVFLPRPDTRVRALVSKGFRSPQLNELYMYPTSNPELRPERLWNYELGAEHSFGPRITLGATAFHMRSADLIETAPNPYPPPMFKFQNTGLINLNGLELTGQAALTQEFSARVFYTYLDPGLRTKGRPKDKLDLAVFYVRGKFALTLFGQHVWGYYGADQMQNKLPSYFLLNARLDWQLSRHVIIMMDGNNLFDTDYRIYTDLPGSSAGVYQMPGRAVKIGLRVKV
jgi:iron complex outermembrane receptor protein